MIVVLLGTWMESKPVHAMNFRAALVLIIGYLLHEIQVTALLLTYHFVVWKGFGSISGRK